jgi:hypothetical protein
MPDCSCELARAWKGIDQKRLTKEQLSELTTEKDKRKIELKRT